MDPTLAQFLSTLLGGVIASVTAWWLLRQQIKEARDEREKTALTATNDSFRALLVEMDFNMALHPPGPRQPLWVAFQRDAFNQARPYLKVLPDDAYKKIQRAINQMAAYNALVAYLNASNGKEDYEVGVRDRLAKAYKELLPATSEAYHALDSHLTGNAPPALPPANP